MDKNTIIGFSLIALLLFGFSYLNRPSEEELEQQRRAQEEQLMAEADRKADSLATVQNDSIAPSESLNAESADSIATEKFGAFANAATAKDSAYTIENNKIRLVISSKGGQLKSVEVKNFKTNSQEPLVLFNAEKDGTDFNLTLTTKNDRVVETRDLNFEPVGFQTIDAMVTKGERAFTFRLTAADGSYLDYIYTLNADDYMVGFAVKPHGMQNTLKTNSSTVDLTWHSKIKQQERSKKFEDRYASIYYKPTSDDVDDLSASSNDSEEITTKVRWIAFKDQFFSSILIADNDFASAKIESKKIEDDPNYLKEYTANILMPLDVAGNSATNMRFYFGPNKYKELKAYDKDVDSDKKLHLDEIVPLGWTIFGWINKYAVIPIFDFFSKYISSYGIIILIMTIIIKIVLFPLTYKSYLSTAKMRVLKPQIEEINKKYASAKPQEKQAATMQLYRQAGVNPMGGCLPMLLQMPILFAMFTFFPAAFELRQQSFLWAEDLSSYDAIVEWSAQIPFITNYFGNHLSLFCLLMTVTNIIYTYINMKTTDTGQNQMPGMKLMMYFMPLMFLFIFNDYASGLSYYYFISTLITIAQTLLFRAFVNEEKLLAQLRENAKNPKKQKKSRFMQRLEEMQKQQLEYQRQQAKERAKRR
jgi:YidC/Oxa1 family membrane protein insertase